MKLNFWGTAAAEGIPAVFCNCKVCNNARTIKGENIRTRSQVFINNELLVDFNADTYSHSLKYNYNISQLEHVLITHVHEDHFYPHELLNRQIGFSYNMKNETLVFHGTKGLLESFYRMIPTAQMLIDQKRVAFNMLEVFQTYKILDYEVTPLPAVHGTYSPYIYVIKQNGKTILYGNDCGPFPQKNYDFLEKNNIKFDLIIYDCTIGNFDCQKNYDANSSHCGLIDNIRQRDNFIKLNLCNKNTIHVVTHFSHNAVDFADGVLFAKAKEKGFTVASDGMVIDI